MKRRSVKNKNNNLILYLLIGIAILSVIDMILTNYSNIVLPSLIVFFVSLITYKLLKKRKLEKRRNELLQYNSKEQKQLLMYLTKQVNIVLSLQKYKLTQKEKQLNKQAQEKYGNEVGSLNRGYVYFVREPALGAVKIGKALDPLDRVAKGFGVKFPYILELIHLIPTENDYIVENMFHRKYAKKRMNGEWFQLTKEDVEWIKSGDYPIGFLEAIVAK